MSLIGQAGPGKLGFISRAKGWEICFLLLPLPFELDRIERCLSSSKEARRSNPGCCTLPSYVEKQHRQSNPGVRSYGRLLVVDVSHREFGRGGKTLLFGARPSLDKAGEGKSFPKSRRRDCGLACYARVPLTLLAWGASSLATGRTGVTTSGTGLKTRL